MPLALLAAILSRMRSPVTSRSNCAKDSRTFNINRPIEVAELICCVTALKLHAMAVEHIDHPREIGQRARQAVDLVDHHDVDPPGLDIGHQAFERGPVHVAAREPAILVVVGDGNPALLGLDS
jgi:hypothetical protein